ncbi:MAG: hypothetical protein M1822_009108 [Bathelium mastoideum]|nr:MAG: hypothetical protein M1822_009108 [Bathelium mastoideum]
MEAVGAVVSILSLVEGATACGKHLYEVVSSLKTASQQVASLASALRDLQGILFHLQNELNLANLDADFPDVRRVVSACYKDLLRYEILLDKITSISESTRAQQAWKKVRVLRKEKDIQQIHTEVIHHNTVLTFQLNVLQSSAIRLCRNKLTKLNDTFSIESAQRSAILLEQGSHLSTVNSSIASLEATTAGQIQAAFRSIMQTVKTSPHLSHSKGEDIHALLKSIQTQVGELSTHFTPAENIGKSSQQNDLQHRTDQERYKDDAELTESMYRLSQLAMNNAQDLHDDDAVTIIEDLARVLNSISKPHTDTSTVNSEKGKANGLQDKEAISDRELKRICGIVDASHSIGINKSAPRLTSALNGKITRKCEIRNTQTGSCEVAIMVHEKSYLGSDCSINKDHNQQKMTDATAKVKIVLKHSHPSTVLTAYLCQTRWEFGYSFLTPVISIGKVLPSTSLIFKVVQSGDVEGLQNLLSRRAGTLRDRNEAGCPLIHVRRYQHISYTSDIYVNQHATFQPRMCKFLIENGADIDEIVTGDTGIFRPPLFSKDTHVRLDHGTTAAAIECMRLFLQAGADPTIDYLGTGIQFQGAFEGAVRYGTEESLRTMLDFGAPYINFGLNERGETPLTLLAENLGEGFTATKFQILLDRGAEIDARNKLGRTCLHVYLQNARMLHSEEVKLVVFLISKGADVNSIDSSGCSITDTAYEYSGRDPDDNIGGYRGDLWDAALSRCGLNIHKRRRRYGRMPQYTRKYKREDFEKLWEGREEDCPYFDDPPFWLPNSNYSALSADEDDMEEFDVESTEDMDESEKDTYELLDDYMIEKFDSRAAQYGSVHYW